jgi:hypothetical protein
MFVTQTTPPPREARAPPGVRAPHSMGISNLSACLITEFCTNSFSPSPSAAFPPLSLLVPLLNSRTVPSSVVPCAAVEHSYCTRLSRSSCLCWTVALCPSLLLYVPLLNSRTVPSSFAPCAAVEQSHCARLCCSFCRCWTVALDRLCLYSYRCWTVALNPALSTIASAWYRSTPPTLSRLETQHDLYWGDKPQNGQMFPSAHLNPVVSQE